MDLHKLRQELTELQHLYEAGKDRNDSPVKVIEDKIRIALNVPQECWFPASHSLKVLIENICGQLDTLQNLSLSLKMIPDEDVLRNASGGLALEGVYKTNNPKDLLAKREQLIEVPDSFSITGPQQSAIHGQKEFSSQKSQTAFQEVVAKLGFSFSDLVKTESLGIGIGSTEEEIKLRKTEEKSTHSYEETYICNTKYSYIPLGSSIIEKNQLKISSTALNALKDVEADFMCGKDSETVTSRIAKFYDRFGSHVNQGPIHFGGIFWWIASATVLSTDDLSDIKRLTSEALNDFVSAGYSTSGIASSPQLKGSSIGLFISKIGGPAEVDNHLQWKSHLMTSNITWSVIDRGITLIPVWEILKAAHKDDFKDILNLSKILMHAHTNITMNNFEANRAKFQIQSVVRLSASECLSQLTKLHELKSRLLEKTGSHNIWIICLSDEMFQNYLLEAATINSDSMDVRTLMCSLLEPHAFSVEKFPNRKKILAWINQTQEDETEVMGTQMNDRRAEPEDTVYKQDDLLLKQVPSLSQLQQTDEENTPQNDTVCTKRDSFMNLLQKLGLTDSYPKMMTKSNVLLIDTLSLSVNQPSSEKELSSHYLYKLMMLDYRARYMFIKHDTSSMDLEDDRATVDNDDFFDFGDNISLDTSCTESHIHPMDVHMAVFHCANDFLRQYIFQKLSTCQFAIPFLVPDPCTEEVEFPFWVLQQISKSWQSKTNSTADNLGEYKSRKMSCTPVPVVSFIRLGVSKSNSKSQILNDVISKQKYSVFFHRHCNGSTQDILLMNGVVEISWYCPGGKEDDIFDDCVAFLNLHGDAAKHQKQLEFLQAVSTVIVLLLSEHPLGEAERAISQKLSKSPVPLICMFSGKELIQPSKNPTKVRLAAKNRNHAEFTKELILSVRQCIGENKQTASIDMCSQVAIQQQFKVNEVHNTYQEGYEQAQTLICLLKLESSLALKEKLLPLQGDLWHEWCRKNKEQYRLQCKEKESIEHQLNEITVTMDAIRQSQLCKATPLNDFVRSFIYCLNTPNTSQDTKLYTVQWLTILLDNFSTDGLAELEVDYHSTWRKMRDVPKDKEKMSHVNQMQLELDNISDKMAATTVGIHHLMREVGQLYEASLASPNATAPTKQFSTSLPKIGADMLVRGCPLELMDGDAAHVPLTWIEAVMDELVKILGDKKLFVLSILGLQSSGKSTLLNTMFGVQFSVSAGRCTHGAFMQLIPVDFSISNQLGYDFVLIVDTEGLRSPERCTKISMSHDNELATFIIGLGDITVINIMGENPSEIQDILQICVQAFLRMKQVKIAPSCIFVHQNVADASAGEKAMEGRRHLQQNLDKMATIVASEENIDGINAFSDVIQFDIETQVFYFKNLLEGDPPMAPPNPSYSQNVQELKTKLLTIAEWKTEHHFSSFSEVKSRVGDLWKSLLKENFIFSFRNTVEMMVYTSLEEKYAAWSWELRKHALEMQSKLHNQIGSNLIMEVNASDLIGDFDKVYNQLQNKIDKYCKEDRYKETLIKWRVNIDKRFGNLRTELIDGTVKTCKELITSRNDRSELDQRKTEYLAELTKQSKALATKLKEEQRFDDMQVREEFNKLWENWTAEVAKAQNPKECINVKAVVEAILQKSFEKEPNVLQKIKQEKVERGKFEFDKDKHVINSSESTFQKVKSWWKGSSLKILEEVNHSVNIYITTKENNKEDFNESFIHEILTNIEKTINEFKCSPGKIKFTNAFKADFSIHLCLKNVSRFQGMQETFKTANHPLTYLESKRDTYLQAFLNYCKGTNSVTICVDFLCKHIKPGVVTAVNDKTSQHIAEKMKSNNPAFNSNRSNLENHIMKHLAVEGDFSSFVEYIEFPKRYFERFIQEKTDKFCSDTGKLLMMHEENLGILKNLILSTSTEATREVKDKEGNTSMWLDCFCRTLGEHMVINRNELHTIEKEDIKDWQFFEERMAQSLDKMLKDEKTIHGETLRKKPTEYLFKQLQGCWAQCPFCKAVCTNTIPDHDGDHSVTFHRCDALAGWHYGGTDNFTINFCTTAVSSNDRFFRQKNDKVSFPFKNHRKAGDPYDKWNITPDGSVRRYWKWFIWAFQEKIEKKYEFKFVGAGKIPKEWKDFTKESALEELEQNNLG